MECKICHKKFKALTNTHLINKHNITPKEYEIKFNCSTVPSGWCKKEANPFYEKSHTNSSKVKSKEYAKAAYNRRKNKTYEELYGVVKAQEMKTNAFLRNLGSNNPMYGRRKEAHPLWNGGYTNKRYSREYTEIRPFIKTRDGNQCAYCHNTINLHVHHIDYNENNNSLMNLITLCISCHMTTNYYDRNYWYYFFSIFINSKYGNPERSLSGDTFERAETTRCSLTNNVEGNNSYMSTPYPIRVKI